MATSLVAHDLHRMLTQPLWRDEDWVALSLRAPFDKIVSLTATTPVLFTALLRVTPHWSPSSLRLLPLAFTVAAVVPAWYLGREIDRHSWLTRVALAAGVAFAPAMLARHDLKQYTAEAFDALVLLWLLARLEANWSRRNLVVLGAALGLSTLLSNGAMFLGPAVLICLAFVLILRRELHRLRDLAIVGAATLAFDFVVFVVIDRPADTPSLKAYWNAFYVPTSHGLANAIHFVHFRAGAELQSVGLGPSIVVGALILAGIVTLWRRGFPALALVVPVAAVEQLIAAGAHDYPLWDPRTSTWFTVMLTVYALIGLTGLARLARFAIGRWREGPNAAMAVKCTALFAVLVLVGLVVGLAAPYVHAARAAVDTATPPEDVHGQVQTIEAQHRPGDVIVSNVDAGFGLGIYWPAQPEFVFHEARLNTFRIAYPPADRIVVATTISTAAEIQAVRTAVAMAAATPHGRVWLVLSHWHKPERATMVSTLREYGTLTTPPDQHGMELVHLLTLRRPVPPTADAP
ncbi:MAG TPA: hypothetical protein VEJ87_05055 [Acidimicrobiales bacterium]|nr:hypothetical protein [Acidimicrobiales bacterium]